MLHERTRGHNGGPYQVAAALEVASACVGLCQIGVDPRYLRGRYGVGVTEGDGVAVGVTARWKGAL